MQCSMHASHSCSPASIVHLSDTSLVGKRFPGRAANLGAASARGRAEHDQSKNRPSPSQCQSQSQHRLAALACGSVWLPNRGPLSQRASPPKRRLTVPVSMGTAVTRRLAPVAIRGGSMHALALADVTGARRPLKTPPPKKSRSDPPNNPGTLMQEVRARLVGEHVIRPLCSG